MSALVDWLRWPNLGIERHPQLDWVVTVYEAEKIRQMADAAEQGDWNPWTHATVDVLRKLADTDDALDAINHRRPKIPREVLGLNRALHYLVRLELRKDGEDKRVRAEVATLWDSESETVRRDVTDLGERARKVIDELLSTLQLKTRVELLSALDRDMEHRAAHMVGEF